GEVAARLDGLLGALPWRAQHDGVGAVDGCPVGRGGRVEVSVLGVVGGADAVGDVVVGAPGSAESAPDVARSDDCDLHWDYATAEGRSPIRTHFEVSYGP